MIVRLPQAEPTKHLARYTLASALALFCALLLPLALGWICVADDLGAFHLPLRKFYADCLAHSERFDWWPQLFCGWFATGEGQLGGYHPLHWVLYRLLPLPTAFALECVAAYPVLFAGVYLFLKRQNLSREAALFGAIASTFSGFCLLHFIHINAIQVVAHLPWLLLAIDGVVRSASPRVRRLGGVAVALLTGSQILLGYPQYIWLCLVAELGYAIWLTGFAGSDRRTVAKAVAAVCCWIMAGVLLGAVQWLPTLEALQESTRGDNSADIAGWGSLAPANLIQFVAPYLFASRVVGDNTHEFGLYCGAPVLLLAVWALTSRGLGKRMKRLRAAAVGLSLIGLVLALGQFSPLHVVLSHLPLVGKFRFPCRAIVLMQLGVAVLAAMGFHQLQQGREDNNLGPLRAIWICFTASFAAALIVPMVWPSAVGVAWLVWLGPALFLASVRLVTLASRQTPGALAALVALAAVDLAVYGFSYAVLPGAMAYQEFLKTLDVPPAKSVTRLAIDLTPVDQPGLHTGNAATLLGWSQVDGYAGLIPSRRLDYRSDAALRAAGVDWISPSARAAQPPGTTVTWQRLGGALPRARLVANAVVSDAPARDIERIDLASTALVDQPIELPDGDGDGETTVARDRPGDIALHVSTPARRLLVLTERFHSGWQLTANGRDLPLLLVNGDFLGCVVEPGISDVCFQFRPLSLAAGRWASLLTLGVLAVAAAWPKFASVDAFPPC